MLEQHDSSEGPGLEVRLGEWVVRPAEGLLLRDGEQVRLRPRSMEVLERLAARQGELVSKEELLREIWEGNAVEEGALAHCISEIRSALGDTPRSQRYIETLPKRGYRLVAELGTAASGGTGPSLIRRRLSPWILTGLALGLAAAGLLAWRAIAGVGPREGGTVSSGASLGQRPRIAV
ncbi:MAG: transcriptional regulator, partial [Acidobacteria bacterium]|nr:transcriptional regulator [Acidobacteriota bacterium]